MLSPFGHEINFDPELPPSLLSVVAHSIHIFWSPM